MEKEHQINFWYVAAALIGVVLIQSYWVQLLTVGHIPYSEFRSLVESGKVTEVVVGDRSIYGKFADPADRTTEFATNKVDGELADYLSKYKVRYSGESDATWLTTLLSWVIPTLVFVGIWMFAIRRMAGGTRVLIPHEREVIAFHETGHALVAMALPGVDPVQKVSIIPRGIGALGYTIQRPVEDRFLMDRTELERKLAVLLGGRAAETIAFAAVSIGAADDLQKATDIARNMATRFGMVAELGQVSYDAEPARFLTPIPGMPAPSRWYSEVTTARIDAAVREIVDAAFFRARTILTANRALLEEMARTLIDNETLSDGVLATFAKRVDKATLPATAAA
ncbi:ATP-dependent metallopeptidase FtsH/Yme1/Tma family protein [Enhydrobacter sp.]|jgi:ATP-dependent Zn protease|uniref:ATP-dependent metallopeptidase FtsH/Yme1/Tma family protein n=1 Tax=Enhydrobacter sp. TaxID=1894999 RepID=UPI0026322669|nr:ATP-dependent metallopeptidase FtsH/Yme1/Tma family protein [Enhydrobacter sp.]WIM11916.1 MAG: Cell division-associated, ATP-dependent zinc metalloprotease FtsH [Enhydrobacter sp.]